jgi:phosphoglycolate phosphatase
MSSQKTLLLFDIDGTLLSTGGCGERALKLAVRDYFGVEDALQDIDISGRTDRYITRQILSKYGRPETDEMDFLAHYLRHLPLLLPLANGRILPGVVALLNVLRERRDVILALLTGNLARGAEYKLGHYDIAHYFEFGAFADDHHDRNELGHAAQSRAQERGYTVAPEKTFVIGDTPHDIACARAAGFRAIAVATGACKKDTLLHADSTFTDLSDTAAVLHSMMLE